MQNLTQSSSSNRSLAALEEDRVDDKSQAPYFLSGANATEHRKMLLKLSSSQSLAVLEDTTDATQSPRIVDQRLRAHFRRLPILGGAMLVVVVIASMMIVLQGQGVTIDSFPTDTKDDAQIKSLLDYYNSITGSIGSFVAKPIDFFLGLLVAAAYICFATDFTLACNSASHWKLLPVLTTAALAYLFSNGLNSLNVQVAPGDVTVRISARDLAFTTTIDDQPLFPNGSLLTAWDRSFAESASGNSVLNTILRSKLLPRGNVSNQCTETSFEQSHSLLTEPLVTFGFQSRTWQAEALANALKPVAPLKIPMSVKSASKLPSNASLPFPVTVASNLVLVGIDVVTGMNLPTTDAENPFSGNMMGGDWRGNVRVAEYYGLLPHIASASSSSNFSEEALTKRFLNASHALWLDAFSSTVNATVNSASVEYARVEISDNIAFDAMTIELPITLSGVDETMQPETFCSRDGCVIESVAHGEDGVVVQPRAQAARICVNDDGTEAITVFVSAAVIPFSACNRTSNSSMFVVSIGKRIEGDVWDKTVTEDASAMRLQKMRVVYSITVGRLSWKTEDLARAFGAECNNEAGCEGLRFQMQPGRANSSDYLVVGNSSIQISDLGEYDTLTPANTKWKSLVLSGEVLGQQGSEVLLPRRFSRVTASGAALSATPAEMCSQHLDRFVQNVEKNHLYMEQSLQTSYTAAFYFLFQNAVLQKSLSTSAGQRSATSQTRLAFAGNSQQMNVQVSIPTANAVVSLVGCFLLLLTGIGILVLAKRSESLIQERANAEIVTEAMVNSTKYPPLLITLALGQTEAASATTEVDERPQLFPLQELRVQSVTLQHNDDMKRVFHIDTDVTI